MRISKRKFGIFGTVEFDLEAKGHRGKQTFVFYPSDIVGSESIPIQSDKRYGYYFPKTGKIRLSKSRSNGSYSYSYILDSVHGKITELFLSDEDREEMNKWLKESAGNTADSVVKINNRYAGSQI